MSEQYRTVVSHSMFELGRTMNISMDSQDYANYIIEILKMNETVEDVKSIYFLKYLNETLRMYDNSNDENWEDEVIKILKEYYLSHGYRLQDDYNIHGETCKITLKQYLCYLSFKRLRDLPQELKI